MSAFGGLLLTNKGRILQAKAQTGVQLQFTRIAIGDGDLGGSSILELNALKHEVKSLSVSKLKPLTGGKAVVGSYFSNSDIASGFYWREIGVFAQDPDEGEILYCYGNSGVNAEYIPAGGGSDIIEKSVDVVTIIGNAANVTANIDTSLVFVTVDALNDLAGAGRTTETVKGNADAIGTLTQEIDYIEQGLTSLDQEVASHLAENVIHVAGGTANGITITTGGDFQYTNGAYIKFKAVANNTSNVTLNIDSKGIKALKKLDGSQIPANGIKIGKVYEVYYDSGNDCFFLLARAEGDAVAGDVLAGKRFSNDDDTGIVGTMLNRGQQIITPGTSNITIPAGYHNGTGYVVGDPDLVSSNIKSGVSIFGVSGSSTVVDTSAGDATASQILSGKTAYVDGNLITGTMPNRGTYNITPGTTNKTIPSGYHSGSGVVYGDPDLVASNIKSGVSIFGVTGTVIEGKRVANGQISVTLTVENQYAKAGIVSVRGLTFQPSKAFVASVITANSSYRAMGFIDSDGVFTAGAYRLSTSIYAMLEKNGDVIFYNDGFDFPVRFICYDETITSGTNTWTWYAIE